MRPPRFGSIFVTVSLLAPCFATGCAHSEDEWTRQVRANEDLRTKLAAEQTKGVALRGERTEAVERLERLQGELREAGLDPARLKTAAAEQARAMEEYTRHKEQAAGARRRAELLATKLAPRASVDVHTNRIVLRVRSEALFEPGRATLAAEGRALLQALAQAIRADPSLAARRYVVAGHVDPNEPGARGAAVPFSFARAEEVRSFLVRPSDRAGGGLPATRWSAAGYGDGDPLGSNQAGATRPPSGCDIVVEPEPGELPDLGAGGT